MKEFGSNFFWQNESWELRQFFPDMAFAYAWSMPLWAVQLLPQLLMQQFDAFTVWTILRLKWYSAFSHKVWNCYQYSDAGPRSAVGNVSVYRCVSDCRSRGREFDPGPVPYFRGDWSWNNFYGHSPPFRWFIQEGLLSVTSESMCTNYWLTACSSLPRKKCG